MRQKNLEYFNVQKISCYFVGLHGPVAKDCHGLRNLQKNWFLPVPFTCILPGKNYRYIHRFNLSMHVYTLHYRKWFTKVSEHQIILYLFTKVCVAELIQSKRK